MDRSSPRSIIVALGALAIVAAGCSSGGPTAAPATATPAPVTAAPVTAAPVTAAPPTAAPTPAATTAATGPDICAASDASGGEPVAAGTYRFAGGSPAYTLTLPAGYTVACSLSTLSLFGAEGAIILVMDLGEIGVGGAPVDVEPNMAAMEAALTAAAASVEGPLLETIGGIEGNRLIATTGAAGLVFKGVDGRGWAYSKEEAADAAVTFVEVEPGTFLAVIRHADDPAALGVDVLESIVFE